MSFFHKIFLVSSFAATLFSGAMPTIAHAQLENPFEPTYQMEQSADEYYEGDSYNELSPAGLGQGLGQTTIAETVGKIVRIALMLMIPVVFVVIVIVLVIYFARKNSQSGHVTVPSAELLAYVKEQKAAGFTQDKIREKLLQNGWDLMSTDVTLAAVFGGPAQLPALAPGLGGRYVKSYKKIGAFLVAGPLIGIFLVLILYAIGSAMGAGGDVFGIFFAFIGIVVAVCLIIGIPLGITFFVRRDEPQFVQDIALARANPLYKGLTEQELVYILDWSWAAFFGGFVWPLGEKIYLWSLIAIASSIFPFGPIVIGCVLGREGRKYAWEKGWPSFQEFRRRQTVMAWVVAAAIILVPIIVFGIMFAIVTAIASSAVAY